MENVPELLHIAVTGESGSGKSSFVNAFRGLDDGDEGAAPTDCVETTMEVTSYPHPKYPKYKKKKSEFKEEMILDKIRKNCTEGVQQQGVESPQVFLVSSFNLELYDFPDLGEILERDIPAHKRNTLLMVVPGISWDVINKKKEAFHSRIKYFALGSAGGAAVPVPVFSIAVDMRLLVGAVTEYIFGFGLDMPSLRSLANRSNVPLKDLLEVIVSPLAAKKITPELVRKALLPFTSIGRLIAAEEVCRFIPVFGILVSLPISAVTTYKILEKLLDMLAEDAQRVFKRALGLETSV